MRQITYGPLAALILAFALLLSACGGMSNDEYLRQVQRIAQRYNSARDVVDRTIRAADSAATLRQGLDAASRGSSNLDNAIGDINSAYRDFGGRNVPEKFHKHQQATSSAWRAGIEAATTVKLYLERFVTTGKVDDTLVLAANRLFAEEDRYQLEARGALQAVR